jgi:hypothetical protein
MRSMEKNRSSSLSGKPGRNMGEAVEILREQQNESDMEELWMEGPAIVNEDEPRVKSLRIL